MEFINFPSKTLSVLKGAQTARRKPGLWAQVLIFIAVFLTAQMVISFPIALFSIDELINISKQIINSGGNINLDEAMNQVIKATMLPMLFFTIAITLAAMLYCATIEIRPLSSMGFVKKSWLSQYSIGILVGVVLFGGYILIGVLSGSIEYRGVTIGESWWIIPIFFLGYVIQGMSEEVLLRGYLMISLTNRVTVFWAVFINSVLFSMLHLFNPGISPIALLNIAIFGIVMSLYFLLTGNIWGVSAIHMTWNFLQGNIFGCAVSGMESTSSLFSFAPVEGFELLGGGSFGPEGGIISTMILLAACVILIMLLAKKRPKKILASDKIDEIVVA